MTEPTPQLELFAELEPKEELAVFLDAAIQVRRQRADEQKMGIAFGTSHRLAVHARLAAFLICTGPTELQDRALEFLFAKLKHYMSVARGEQKIDLGFGPIDVSIAPISLKDLGLDQLYDGKPQPKAKP